MADFQIPEAVPRSTLQVGERTFTLVSTVGTGLKLRRHLRSMGIDVDDEEAIKAAIDDAELALLQLWAMAAHGENRDITPDEFAELIPMDALEPIIGQATEVAKESSPEKKPAKGKAKGGTKKKAKKT